MHFSRVYAIIIKRCENSTKYPGVAQMVACLNGVQEAGGSNPLTQTRKSPEIIEEISTAYDAMCVVGNGADSDILEEAGAGDAELVVAVTGVDELNMLSCFLARRMGAKHTVARIRNPEYNDNSFVQKKKENLICLLWI